MARTDCRMTTEECRHFALVYIDKRDLPSLLLHGILLPDGYRVTDVREDFVTMSLVFKVHSCQDLPETPKACEPPRLALYRRETGQLEVLIWRNEGSIF